MGANKEKIIIDTQPTSTFTTGVFEGFQLETRESDSGVTFFTGSGLTHKQKDPSISARV